MAGGGQAHRAAIAPGSRVAAPGPRDRTPAWPGYQGLTTAGGMGALFLTVIRVAVTPPFPWLRDAVVQFSIHARRNLLPLTLSLSAFIIGYAVFWFAQLIGALGAIDRLPGLVFAFALREFGGWIATMIFAGVAGSAVCADLGARKVREELDALSVLGVDRIRSLVLPRVAAMAVLAPLLGLIGIFTAELSIYITGPGVLGFSRAVFRDSVAHSIVTADLIAFLLKLFIIGVFVGIVACYKGLASTGGAEGVGRAVNQAVVTSFLGIWLIHSVFSLVYLALFPETAVLRG